VPRSRKRGSIHPLLHTPSWRSAQLVKHRDNFTLPTNNFTCSVDFVVAKSCADLSPDHSPVYITLTALALNQEKQPSLSNIHTNWDDFRHLINQRLTLNDSLKTEQDIEAAVKFFNDTIQ
jgi:hypothetical protein